MSQASELLDIAQASALLQVSETSLRRWTNAGRLPCLRVGGRRERRFRRADLLAFLEGTSGAASNTRGDATGHLCGFYMSDLGRARQAAALLGEGLAAGSVCFLGAEPDVRERILARLARQRSSLQGDLDAGRLVVSEYAELGATQLEFWETQFGAAARGGTRSLRVVGDVSGGRLAQRNSFEEVIAYETEYSRLARRFPVATACLYDARRHSGVETARLLQIHADLFRHPSVHLVS